MVQGTGSAGACSGRAAELRGGSGGRFPRDRPYALALRAEGHSLGTVVDQVSYDSTKSDA